MPWRQQAKKDVEICEKPRKADNKRYYPGISEWGNPTLGSSVTEYIGCGSEPGELKHLSTPRKRNQPRFRQ